MKKLMSMIVAMTLMISMLSAVPVSAQPYTMSDIDDFFVSLYVQQVWVIDFPEFTAQFIDADLDEQYELISIEAGEEYAPKQATVYALMHGELSGRGRLTVGKLSTCYDPKTDEYFMVNRMIDGDKEIVERLVYDYDDMVIKTKAVSDKQAARLEDCGYTPVIITKEDCEAVTCYEDMYALLWNAYDGVTYTNMQPPTAESYNEELDQTSVGQIVLVAGCATAAAVVIATVALVLIKRRKKKK